MAKKINMKSWHFKLYKNNADHWISELEPHRVNRCRYLKGVLMGIGNRVLIALLYTLAVAIVSCGPFAIFAAFMKEPTTMCVLATTVTLMLLAWISVKAKERIEAYSSRFITIRKVNDGFIGIGDLIYAFFYNIERRLCPIWIAEHPDYLK